jgi:RsiW-degrading membrane proteinase PrsW (M82 family)
MTRLVAALLAIAPSLLLLWYFYKRDVFPEPRGVLFKTFMLGVLCVIPVVIVALPLMMATPANMPPVATGLYVAFLCAAIPEEFFKYLVVTRYCARHPAFDEPMDGVVYGAAASLGFATAENILYVSAGGWHVAIARGLTAVPCHACLGAIMGYFVGQARFAPGRVYAWYGYVVAMLLHGLYDFAPLTLQQMEMKGELQDELTGYTFLALVLMLTLIVVFVVEIVWTRRIVHRLRSEQLQQSSASMESAAQ